MDTWHNGTTWEEFADTAPCLVRPEWIAAFKTRLYPRPADLYFSFIQTLEAGADPIETTTNFLRARGCPMYSEEVLALVGVILMGVDDLKRTDALWVSPNTPWRVSPMDQRLEQADKELMAMNGELELIRHRLARVNQKAAAIATKRRATTAKQEERMEDERNAAALAALEPRVSITLMCEKLKVNGMFTAISARWRDVYARGGVAMVRHKGTEYRLERAMVGVGGNYIGRRIGGA
jgi:hypothetical protein